MDGCVAQVCLLLVTAICQSKKVTKYAYLLGLIRIGICIDLYNIYIFN